MIETVVKNATVPVIETGTGNCHIYVDDYAEPDVARDIIYNAKVQRPSVCNSLETLLVNAEFAGSVFTFEHILKPLLEAGVELRCCPTTCALLENRSVAVKSATDEDYFTEFNDLVLAVKSRQYAGGGH